MAEIKDLEKLKRRVDSLKTEIAHATGARDEALRNLEEEFGIKTLSAAKSRLTLIIDQEEEAKTSFTDALKKFEEAWNKKIEE